MVSTDWTTRITTARADALAARAAEEQTIRDAVADGMKIADICRALGTKNRNRVHAIMGRGADGGKPQQPRRTPTVYLRGAQNGDEIWERVETAMWARGWATERDRLNAWHLARGGAPVVMCDFSADLDDSDPPLYGYQRYILIGRVRARYTDVEEYTTVGALITTTAEHLRLSRAGADWLNTQITHTAREHELVLINGGKHNRDKLQSDGMLDGQALARLVAAALEV